MESKELDHAFSPAERIEQLNEIDQDVIKLLRAAGLAIQALTNTPLPTNDNKDPQSLQSPSGKGALAAHQEAFKAAASQYFSLLSSIDVRLRRQVYALEEASIIRPESTVKTGEGVGTTAFNPLETSWLNTRKDTVGKDKEAELWAQARDYVNALISTGGEDSSETEAGDAPLKQMEID
ncbi:conserved hypothetical protein [Uncinocarpus reesii 1704]|uniref:Mediator of RNA polymerase II transcription subunit 11 n=1 Tax=Uncinocarpus reesii (strain UAMH 1704) TaxID=336963 RepID=C4JW07_UNCRE|nr:uncharacterized protein UREG_06749 [Uncinocarpus reesii 1704]EEP81884.1 conserved hypothetical protein [Uncinocarpus reesii 1704]